MKQAVGGKPVLKSIKRYKEIVEFFGVSFVGFNSNYDLDFIGKFSFALKICN